MAEESHGGSSCPCWVQCTVPLPSARPRPHLEYLPDPMGTACIMPHLSHLRGLVHSLNKCLLSNLHAKSLGVPETTRQPCASPLPVPLSVYVQPIIILKPKTQHPPSTLVLGPPTLTLHCLLGLIQPLHLPLTAWPADIHWPSLPSGK